MCPQAILLGFYYLQVAKAEIRLPEENPWETAAQISLFGGQSGIAA